MSNRQARKALALTFCGFAIAFGAVSIILYVEGGVSATDGFSLAFGGAIFGIVVSTSIIKPKDLAPVPSWFLRLLQVFSWGVATAGFIVFVAIWAHFLLSPSRASPSVAWKTGALALTILFAITPSAMTIDDWRTRLEEETRSELNAGHGVDGAPNKVGDADDASGRDAPDNDLPAVP